jgi:2-epi-5-epi-valiolone 7-phosphate 2-epimerase
VRRAATLGFQGIHLSSGDLDGSFRLDDQVLREAYVDAARASGGTLDAVAGGDLNDLGLTSAAGSPEAERCEATIRLAIDAAADMHVPLVFLPSFRAGEIRDDADLHRTATVLASACDYVGGRPVTIATENTLGVDGNLELLRLSGRPGLRILLDTQNPSLWGHDVAAMIEPLWPYLTDQIHVKDGRAGKMGNAILGDGDAAFATTARELVARGYRGSMISENDYHGARAAAAKRDIAVLDAAFGS